VERKREIEERECVERESRKERRRTRELLRARIYVYIIYVYIKNGRTGTDKEMKKEAGGRKLRVLWLREVEGEMKKENRRVSRRIW